MTVRQWKAREGTLWGSGRLRGRSLSTTRSKLVALVGAMAIVPASFSAISAVADGSAATGGGNFIATGHDMDLHCYYGQTPECSYLKIAVDKVRNGSALPILALDQGVELSGALRNAGYASTSVVTVNPTAASFATTPFVTSAGAPLYSAIVTASDYTCGGCDNSPTGEMAINNRAADFATYFNAGGGILAESAAGNMLIYYNFVPLHVTGAATTSPYTVTAAGAALGITSTMANCCATHNSFASVPSGMQALETDSAGVAETLSAFNASISTGSGDGGSGGSGGGFVTGPPTDSTPPTLAVSHTADGTGGWNTSSVTETVTASDSGSGLDGAPTCTLDSASVTLTAGTTGSWTFPVSGDGSHAISCSASDVAANKSTATDTTKIDSAVPDLSVGHDATSTGWNTAAPVTETVTASDGGSGLAADPTCTVDDTAVSLTAGAAGTWTFTVSGDGTHAVSCSVSDKAGNSNRAIDGPQIDTGAPDVSVSHDASPTGWSTSSPVTETVTAGDGGSGLAAAPSCTVDDAKVSMTAGDAGTWTFAVTGDGLHTVSCSVSDVAGNSNGATDTPEIDTITPAISVSHIADGSNGWNTSSPVTETVVASDSGSGLAADPTCSVDDTAATLTAGDAGTWTFAVSGEGPHAVSCSVSDKAGTSNTATDTPQIDTIIPAISVSHTADGSNGWNRSSPVTETVTAGDGGSGLAATPSCSVDNVTVTPTSGASGSWTFPVSGQGAHAVSCSVSDAAGNANMASDAPEIDTVAPAVGVTGVSNGARYLLNGVPAAGCTTTDATSGVDSNASLSSAGGPVGSVTATCAGATDKAGNKAIGQATYTVNYDLGSGFLSPVNNPSTVNTGKAGRTYPVKFQLKDARGAYITSLSAIQSVKYKSDSCGAFSSDNTDALETSATGGTSLRYDTSANQFVYNWATTSKGCYSLFVTLASGQVMPAYFSLS